MPLIVSRIAPASPARITLVRPGRSGTRSCGCNSRSTSLVPSTTTRTHTRRSAVISVRGALESTGPDFCPGGGRTEGGTRAAGCGAGGACAPERAGVACHERVTRTPAAARTTTPPATTPRRARRFRCSAGNVLAFTSTDTIDERGNSACAGEGAPDGARGSVELAGSATGAEVASRGESAMGADVSPDAASEARGRAVNEESTLSRSRGGVRNPLTNSSNAAPASLRRVRHSSMARCRRSNSARAAPSSHGARSGFSPGIPLVEPLDLRPSSSKRDRLNEPTRI